MKKSKYLKKAPVRQRLLTLILCLSLVLSLTVLAGTTLAWLTDRTDPLISTFTVGTVKIELSQTTEGFKLFPDESTEHDATVTVKANSERCYVFVEIQAVGMTYKMNEGWYRLKEGVYYFFANAAEVDQQIAVFKSVTAAEGEDHTLTVTAYACQYAKDNNEVFQAQEAWDIVKSAAVTP